MSKPTKAPQRLDADTVRRAADERWPELLNRLGGVPVEVLDGNHHPCPLCGGTDRFRMIDQARGAVMCNQCFCEKNGDGFAALGWLTNQDFGAVLRLVAAEVGVKANGNSTPVDVITQVARRKNVTPEALKAFGAEVADRNGTQVCRVPMYGVDGKSCGFFDMAPTDELDKGKMTQGSKHGLFMVNAVDPRRPVVLVEGVKDAAALHAIDIQAVGLPTYRMTATFARAFRDCKVIIVPDRDKAGIEGAKFTAANLFGVAAEVKIAELPAPYKETGGGDVRDVLRMKDGKTKVTDAIAHAKAWNSSDSGQPSESPISKGKPAAITNARLVKDEDGLHAEPIPMAKVIQSILAATDDWPRRVDNALFAHDSERIHWLDTPASLFGWMAGRCGVVDWRRVQGCVSKEETFHQLRRVATSYVAIENFPHCPAIDGHYYTCPTSEPGDGKALAALLDFFCLQTPLDRQLLEAQFATLVWGGPPGTRPALMITAPAGRGKGKTKLAEAMGRQYGGHIDISPQEDIGTIRQRLLSPGAGSKRIALLDNIKRSRFSWAELEALVTIDAISGKRMYVGEASRPNYLCWVITLNGASLSTDMAQRVIEIQIREPDYDPSWEERINRFIAENRPALLADLVGFFQRPKKTLRRYSRWAAWEGEVLGRVEDPDGCLDLILERRGQADVEEQEGQIIEDYLAARLAALELDADRADVFIPNSVAARWYNAATGDRARVAAASRVLRQMISEGRISRLVTARAGSAGARGFRWVGEHADASDVTHYDLEQRIARKAEERPQATNTAGEGEAW